MKLTTNTDQRKATRMFKSLCFCWIMMFVTTIALFLWLAPMNKAYSFDTIYTYTDTQHYQTDKKCAGLRGPKFQRDHRIDTVMDPDIDNLRVLVGLRMQFATDQNKTYKQRAQARPELRFKDNYMPIGAAELAGFRKRCE